MSARVLQIELTGPLPDRYDVAGYDAALLIARWHSRVLGSSRVIVHDGELTAAAVRTALESNHDIRKRLAEVVVEDWLLRGVPAPALPSWSLVICTRDRAEMLRGCLDSVVATAPDGGEIIVIDNAPSDRSTADLVSRYPVRYEREDRPGLNWARSRGARAAEGEIVVFTDDDVIADPQWIPRILEPFSAARIGAVTGLTLPFELETEAQELFERYGGFGRGFFSRVFEYRSLAPAGAGVVGAGANMAIRRDLILQMGLFDKELDAGTITKTGGDTYAYYRLLADGYRIVYNPDALVWHRHRRERDALRATIYGYGVGVYSFMTMCVVEHRDVQALRLGATWFVRHHLGELARSILHRKKRMPLDISFAEFRGALAGPRGYFRSRRLERRQPAAHNPAERTPV